MSAAPFVPPVSSTALQGRPLGKTEARDHSEAPVLEALAAYMDYLRSGVSAGMVLPDPVDPALGSVRVLIEE